MLNDVNSAPAQIPVITAQRSANVVTITTQGPHGLLAGTTPDQAIISSVPVGTLSFNGTFPVASIVNSTQFTYAQTGAAETQNGGFSAAVGLGAVFTDPVLVPYINSAYRRCRRALAMAGMPLFATDEVYLVIPAITADPSVTVAISDTSSPQLPVDLLEPLKLWERANLSNNNFTEMVDMTNHGGLPSLIQTTTLDMWEWRTDSIVFPGAILDVQIRLRYKRVMSDVLDGSGLILIPDSQDCITHLAAAMAAMSRGSVLAEKWAAAGEDGLEALIAATTRRDQQYGRRRRPNSSRTGDFSGGFPFGFGRSW